MSVHFTNNENGREGKAVKMDQNNCIVAVIRNGRLVSERFVYDFEEIEQIYHYMKKLLDNKTKKDV